MSRSTSGARLRSIANTVCLILGMLVIWTGVTAGETRTVALGIVLQTLTLLVFVVDGAQCRRDR